MSGEFSQALLAWYRLQGRHDLPWQGKNPYHIWLSEIMLQQTQVATVIPYFQRLIARFPRLQDLAAASEDELMPYWSGLGYYRRARHLHQAARIMCSWQDWPQEAQAWLALPGVGRSTAAAIVSLAFNQRAAILDGNVRRLLSRFSAARDDERALWAYAESLLPPREDMADYTQALMDCGALICTPRKPRCADCPVREHCRAFALDKVEEFPIRRANVKVQELILFWLLLRDESGRILLQRRPAHGIWGGLWSLPEFSDEATLKRYLTERQELFEMLPDPPPLQHRLTHRKLLIHVRAYRCRKLHTTAAELCLLAAEAQAAGIPQALRRLLQTLETQ